MLTVMEFVNRQINIILSLSTENGRRPISNDCLMFVFYTVYLTEKCLSYVFSISSTVTRALQRKNEKHCNTILRGIKMVFSNTNGVCKYFCNLTDTRLLVADDDQ